MRKMKSIPAILKLGLFLAVLIVCSLTVYADATDQFTLEVEGTYSYAKAVAMLPYINEERAKLGCAPLQLDAELTEAAMQRAAETAVYFSHTRPNQNSCFSIVEKMHGENIAAGSSTTEGAFQQWMDSAGHRQNMMSSSYRSIGIGCFTQGYQYYWVQIFSFENAAASPAESDCKVKTPVQIIGVVNNLEFGMDELSIEVGNTERLEVGKVNDGWEYAYCKFAASSFHWSSGNPTVASVDQNGNIRALAAGETTITAVPINGNGRATSLHVISRYSIASAKISNIENVTYSGMAHTPALYIELNGKTLVLNKDYEVEYQNNINAGNARITVTGIGDYCGTLNTSFKINPMNVDESCTVKFRKSIDSIRDEIEDDDLQIIYKGKNISSENGFYISVRSYRNKKLTSFGIRFYRNYSGYFECYFMDSCYVVPITAQYYTGKAIVPKVKIYPTNYDYYLNQDLLKEGRDYKIRYEKNTSIGSAAIIIEGMGQYHGSLKTTFDIIRNPSCKFTSATLSKNKYSWTGKAILPQVTVKNGTRTLRKGTDYKLTYYNNKEIGTASVLIQGMGSYGGLKKRLYFQILPKMASFTKVNSAKKGSITGVVKRDTQASGYEIQYAGNQKFTSAKSIILKRNTLVNVAIKQLTSKKSYYVRVRSYKDVSGKRIYGTWSTAKKINVK